MLKVLLMEKLDFLGVSAYSPFSGVDFGVNEFQDAATGVIQALASIVGVDIGSLVKSGKLELIYNQFGIGGGQNWMAKMAEAAEACAKQPWAGVSGAYSALLDPWKNSYLGAFRESFFAKALTWLVAPTDGIVGVRDVFVWSVSLWNLPRLHLTRRQLPQPDHCPADCTPQHCCDGGTHLQDGNH
jgi:hypothetical protein